MQKHPPQTNIAICAYESNPTGVYRSSQCGAPLKSIYSLLLTTHVTQNAVVRRNKQSFGTGFSWRPDGGAHLIKPWFAEQEVHFLHVKVITSNKLQRAGPVELKTIGFAVIRKTQGNDDCGTILKGTLSDEGPGSQFILQLEYLEIHN